jgi:oligoribonuclease NrnB/cAMP/cGMP phosphodiesterase (DHH superfamily)
MADVSLPMQDMLQMARHSKYQFTWIDHHQSAMNDYVNLPDHARTQINAYLKTNLSACELCWEYFFEETTPLFVRWLGTYDSWRNQDEEMWEKFILPFQWGARLHYKTPEDIVRALQGSGGAIETVLSDGNTILAYQREQNERSCRSAFEYEFDGLRAICLNIAGASSLTFESVYDEGKHDLMIPFAWNGKRWNFSLYTTKTDSINCSVLAKKRGGGGHKGAAGFQVENLREIFPHLLPENIILHPQKTQ